MDVTLKDIDLIKMLWEKNREYHEKHSEYFGETYQFIRFEERMHKFSLFERDQYKISICIEGEIVIGYCISTVLDFVGEVASLHVDANKRGNGIGEALVSSHLKWMQEMKCKKIGVTVSQENEATIGFYKKLGFLPNTLYMQQKSPMVF